MKKLLKSNKELCLNKGSRAKLMYYMHHASYIFGIIVHAIWVQKSIWIACPYLQKNSINCHDLIV